jgi:hypothetical protein
MLVGMVVVQPPLGQRLWLMGQRWLVYWGKSKGQASYGGDVLHAGHFGGQVDVGCVHPLNAFQRPFYVTTHEAQVMACTGEVICFVIWLHPF